MNVYLNTNFAGLLFLLYCYRHVQGAVTISPPGTALVCSGDQLELICNITGMLLEWNLSKIDETGTARQFIQRGITADGPADIQTFPVVYNSTTFIFSRTSAQGSPILTSRMLISAVSDNLNGTVVTCVDVTSLNMESSSTTIMIINSRILNSEVNVIEQFEKHTAIVTLEWIQNDLYSYYISVIPQTQQRMLSLNETTIVMVNISYNVAYNLTVYIGRNHCMENLTFITQAFYYPYCRDPVHQIENAINVSGYSMDSAIPESSVTFSCSIPGYVLIGSNMSICMSNGEWKPDPRKATECKANCGPPSPPSNCHITESYTDTLEGAEVMFLCQSVFQFGQQSLCKEVNITTVCNQEGIWEPIADNIMCAGPSGSSLSQDGIITIALSISIATVTSALFSTIGYLCGLHRRNQEQNNSSSSANKPAPIYENVRVRGQTEMLDLETNLAYGSVQ